MRQAIARATKVTRTPRRVKNNVVTTNLGSGIFRVGSATNVKNFARNFSAASPSFSKISPSTFDWTKGPLIKPALMIQYHVGVSDPVQEDQKVVTILTEDHMVVDVLVPKFNSLGSTNTNSWFIKYGAEKGDYIPAGSFPVSFSKTQFKNNDPKIILHQNSDGEIIVVVLCATLVGGVYFLVENFRSAF